MPNTPQITALTPRLVVDDAAAAIDYYRAALGAVEQERHEHDGKIVHALLLVGGTPVALKDRDDVDPSPRFLGGSPVIVSLDVADADAMADRMVGAGGKVVFAVDDHGYGYKDGRVEDPFGHLWIVSQAL